MWNFITYSYSVFEKNNGERVIKLRKDWTWEWKEDMVRISKKSYEEWKTILKPKTTKNEIPNTDISKTNKTWWENLNKEYTRDSYDKLSNNQSIRTEEQIKQDFSDWNTMFWAVPVWKWYSIRKRGSWYELSHISPLIGKTIKVSTDNSSWGRILSPIFRVNFPSRSKVGIIFLASLIGI